MFLFIPKTHSIAKQCLSVFDLKISKRRTKILFRVFSVVFTSNIWFQLWNQSDGISRVENPCLWASLVSGSVSLREYTWSCLITIDPVYQLHCCRIECYSMGRSLCPHLPVHVITSTPSSVCCHHLAWLWEPWKASWDKMWIMNNREIKFVSLSYLL